MLFQMRENTVLLSLRCKKLKGLVELMCILNALEGEVCLHTKHVGSTSFLTRLWRMVA